MDTITLNIPSIHCGHCVMNIQRESSLVKGVEFVKGDLQGKTATFKVENSQALQALKSTLAEIGYPAS